MKHRTSTEQRETAPPEPEPELQHVNEGNAKPSMEDTVNLINSRLKERRRELGLPEAIKVGIHVSPGRRLVQGIIRAVPVCAGHVPCPDEYGENQPAEVFAPLRESAWTTGRNRPNKKDVFAPAGRRFLSTSVCVLRAPGRSGPWCNRSTSATACSNICCFPQQQQSSPPL